MIVMFPRRHMLETFKMCQVSVLHPGYILNATYIQHVSSM